MKQQIPVWVALTFLMFFLVVVAAVIFLFQGRYALQDQVATLAAQGTRQALQSENVVLTATAQAIDLADARATLGALEASSSVLAATVEELATDSNRALATIAAQEAAVAAAAAQAPEIVINPADGATLPPGAAVPLLISVADARGILTVTVTINGELLQTFDAQGELLFVNNEIVWQPASATRMTIAVTAVNRLGASATEEVTAELVDREAVLTALVARVLGEVETLRELTASAPVTPTLYTEAELRADFEALFMDDLDADDARRDVVELYAFDFVDLDYDLYGALLELYSGSVLGFYDPDTAELVVVSDDATISPLEQLTLAHEITHALQDQAFGLDLDSIDDSEARLARRALAEGDATLLQTLYLASNYLSEADLDALFAEMASDAPAALPDLPPILQIQQEFPYTAGYEFVRALYREGGYAAVSDAWRNPPANTEHILHPARYLAGELPQIVTLPPLTDTLGAGWTLIDEDVLGEFYVRTYLDQQLTASEAATAAAGWNGDRYAVYWQEARAQVAMVTRLRWDSAGDQTEFEQAYRGYARRKYAGDPVRSTQVGGGWCWQAADVTCLVTVDDESLVLRAPTFALAGALFNATFPTP